jgi:hypothetical protein
MGVGIDRWSVLQLMHIYIVGDIGGGLRWKANRFLGPCIPYQCDRHQVEHLGNVRAVLNGESVLTQMSPPSTVHQVPALPLHLIFQLQLSSEELRNSLALQKQRNVID